MRTLNWNSTWATTDGVLQVHKYRQERILRNGPGEHVQYARTILMTKFASRALYAVPRVRVQSEVYFGL